MAECGLINLGSCLPEKFFDFLLNLINSPIKRFVDLVFKLLSEPITLSLFSRFWAIIVYTLSMFYALFLLISGFIFILSGYDSAKRENAKQTLRNIVIMIILVQSSYFIYQLAIELSSVMTSATLSIIDIGFFSIGNGGDNIAVSLIFGTTYLTTLVLSLIILSLRYAFVSIGIIFFPISIFLYFIPQLKRYGVLILNFLGTSIFASFFYSLILIGFSQLSNANVFSDFKILLLISAFLLGDIIVIGLLLFSIINTGTEIYSKVKGVVGI